METGKGVDDSEYMKQTNQLEALQARLSLAIKEIQKRPGQLGPGAQKVLQRARRLRRWITTSKERSLEQGPLELFGEALEQEQEFREHVHEYHEMLEVGDREPRYVAPKEQGLTVVGCAILLFSTIAYVVQRRKRAKNR